ncbi:MAG TPA: chorismate synthase [Thermodesulfobacteriota bacterium]|nr:chorismate synthase [Thermodesulfobacteriota bacterium]
MSGNVFGVLFRVTTWGESHGPAVGAVVEGCPPAIPLSEQDIQGELRRRRPGGLPSASPRKEEDRVEILSGIFEGRTTGTPISLLIRNKDADSGAYEALKMVFRPGHGDYSYTQKYGFRDHRGGGRASARETAARVAAGAIAKKVIGQVGMSVKAYTLELGGIRAENLEMDQVEKNPYYCPDSQAALLMEKKLSEAGQAGDSLGGIVEILVCGCPAGLGEPVFDKIDADLAKALMSIGSVKGVEIGAGFGAARMTGSVCNDPLTPSGFPTNNAGGILAGITNGADLILRVACKPIPSIRKEQQTINLEGEAVRLSIQGRHDVSVIPRIIPVCEAMVSLVLADHFLRQKAVQL